MKLKPLYFALFALTPGLVLANTLAPVVVSADLRDANSEDIAASVEVLDAAELQDRGSNHFGEALLQIPNVNFSGQSSRPRHIQIRGMGERDEYTGAPNASVGFALDDIDFSGIGMVGNLFDVKQVEVLRGPQSTRYGASALAGLINIQTNEPTPFNESLIEASIGSDNLSELGIMTSGAFSAQDKSPQYRLSFFKHNSDGFRQNDTLNRSDTNKKDELTARAKLRWWAGDDTQFDLTLVHADINNGYDMWSRDNSFTTLSNQPGKDSQLTNAASLKAQWDGAENYHLTSTTSYAQSEMIYSYDENWVAGGNFYENNKKRDNISQELRWTSKQPIFSQFTDWLFGLYGSHLNEKNNTVSNGASSKFQLNKAASFVQLDHYLSEKTTLITGVRIEQVSSNYTHSSGDDFSPSEVLWGGQLTLNHQLNTHHSVYSGLSKGYKSGGFNSELQGNGITDSKLLKFNSETAYNFELGHKYNGSQLTAKTSAFYITRENPQFDGYSYDAFGGGEWVFFTENFDSAKNYGLETELNWQVSSMVKLFANLGLIQTEVTGTPLNSYFQINGREQAHAPTYQFLVGAQYRNDQGWFARLEVQGMDAFYFDNVHNQKSKTYALANGRLGYETKDWDVYLWGKNLTDEKYATRGYFFDHFDGDGEKLYLGLGDPRQIGLTARVRF